MVRIFQPYKIETNSLIELDENAFNHMIKALRMRVGDDVILFDGSNYITKAVIESISKKSVQVKTFDSMLDNKESPLFIHLGQVMSRGEKMEFTIQKAVELGVSEITPLISKRCGVKLDKDRLLKKQLQWQKIAQSACEQCGRNVVPKINDVQMLESWCESQNKALKLTLDPLAKKGMNQLKLITNKIALLVGPEGGLSSDEINMTKKHQFEPLLLGPRVLRTETVALTAITALQVKFGDLG